MGVFRVALVAVLLWREFRRWERRPEPKKSDRDGSTGPARDVAHYGGGSAYDAELDAAADVREREADLQDLLDREAELQTALDAVDAELDAADPDLVAAARAELAVGEDEDNG